LSLWAWAGAAYAEAGVGGACLALQDAHGQSVCLLLWAAWAAEDGRAPSAETLDAAAALAHAWEAAVIGPLRAARRGLKTAPGLDEAARQALRARLQADELAAERALLEALEALAPPPGAGPGDIAAALAAASAAWGGTVPAEALQTLADAFPRA
jgi:uncharacterized protein (TIGR02444 family)